MCRFSRIVGGHEKRLIVPFRSFYNVSYTLAAKIYCCCAFFRVNKNRYINGSGSFRVSSETSSHAASASLNLGNDQSRSLPSTLVIVATLLALSLLTMPIETSRNQPIVARDRNIFPPMVGPLAYEVGYYPGYKKQPSITSADRSYQLFCTNDRRYIPHKKTGISNTATHCRSQYDFKSANRCPSQATIGLLLDRILSIAY